MVPAIAERPAHGPGRPPRLGCGEEPNGAHAPLAPDADRRNGDGLFVAGDWIVPGPSGHARAAVVGLGVAALALVLRAGQLRTAALGTLAFFVLLWVSRGTMTSVSVYLCFPFGCCCAYVGYRRQERGLE